MKTILIITIELIILIGLSLLFYHNEEARSYIGNYQVLSPLLNYTYFLIIVDSFARSVKFFYSKNKDLGSGRKDNFHFGVDNIAKLLIGIGLIVTIFGLLGIDFKSLITSLSIVAAAIAIISKEYINDFMTGIYFSFSKNFEINDYVKFGEHKGKVQEIEMLKIKLLNDDDDLVIIPNGKIYNNEIINYTKRDIRLMSIDFQLDTKTIQNIETLEIELMSSLESFDKFIETNTYNLKIVDVKKDFIDFKFQYRLANTDRDLQREIRKKTVRRIFNLISSKN